MTNSLNRAPAALAARAFLAWGLACGLAFGLAGCASDGGGAKTGTYVGAIAGLSGPRDLVGKSDAQVRASLGTPAFRRADGPAQVWQYRGPACLLDVFLYKEAAGFRVKHAELRRRGGTTMADGPCLADAITNRAKS